VKRIFMKMRQLFWAGIMFLLALPLLANAEVYKWKDKDGVVRYSDTPPPPNIKPESVSGKKTAKPTANSSSTGSTDAKAAPVAVTPNKSSEFKDLAPSPEEEAAKLRQRNAEIEKKNKQEKEAQAKLKEENCKAAKANHEAYAQGGRVYKMNEKGEREYMDDNELKEGAEKAQAEVNANCN
jgi:hypothetical protein